MIKYLNKIARFTMQQVLFSGILAGALYYFTFFNDGSAVNTALNEMNQQVSEQEAKKKESADLLKQEEQIRALVRQLSEQYKLISAQIPTEIQPFEILKTVDAMAATSGVLIKTKEPKKPIKKEIVEEIPLRIVAEGRFAELTLFLFNLVNTERVSRLLSFTIRPISTGASSTSTVRPGNLVLDLVLANYRFLGDAKESETAAQQGAAKK